MTRPVSGLLFIAFATPSHTFTILLSSILLSSILFSSIMIQYSGFVAAHSYRCGGSTGI